MEFNSDVFKKSYDEIILVHKDLRPFKEVRDILNKIYNKGYACI